MHAPPAVSYPVSGRALHAALSAGLGLGGLVLAGAWALQPATQSWRVAMMLSFLGVATLWAMREWRGMSAGVLCWDAEHWHWRPDGANRPEAAQEAIHVEVVMDLQRWMLLRRAATRQSRARWFWLQRRSAPARWADLRRALYSRAGARRVSDANPPP